MSATFSLPMHQHRRTSIVRHSSVDLDVVTNTNDVKQYTTTPMYTDEEFTSASASGILAYTHACQLASIQPSSKVTQQLRDPQHTGIVNLSHYALGPSGGSCLAAALRVNQTITCIDLEDNAMMDVGCSAICNALAEGNSKISFLDLSHNSIGTSGSVALARLLLVSTSLVELRLCHNAISDAHMMILAEAMHNQKGSVQRLDLSHNTISDRGCHALAAMIQHNTSIIHLDLSWNAIRDMGCKALCTSLLLHPTLLHLSLGWNGLSSSCATSLAQLFAANTIMQQLDITSNRIDSMGWIHIVEGIRLHKGNIKEIIVTGNSITPKDMLILDSCTQHHPNLIITCDTRDTLLREAQVLAEREVTEAKQQAELKAYLKQMAALKLAREQQFEMRSSIQAKQMIQQQRQEQKMKAQQRQEIARGIKPKSEKNTKSLLGTFTIPEKTTLPKLTTRSNPSTTRSSLPPNLTTTSKSRPKSATSTSSSSSTSTSTSTSTKRKSKSKQSKLKSKSTFQSTSTSRSASTSTQSTSRSSAPVT